MPARCAPDRRPPAVYSVHRGRADALAGDHRDAFLEKACAGASSSVPSIVVRVVGAAAISSSLRRALPCPKTSQAPSIFASGKRRASELFRALARDGYALVKCEGAVFKPEA